MSRPTHKEIASALSIIAAAVGSLYIVLISTFDRSADPAARANIFVALLPTWPIVGVGAAAVGL